MHFILYAIIIFAVFAMLIFVKPLEVNLLFDSANMDMRVSSTWLNFFKIKAERVKSQRVKSQIQVTFFILGRKILSRILHKKRKIDMNRFGLSVLR